MATHGEPVPPLLTMEALAAALARHRAVVLPDEGRGRAAVAAVLQEHRAGLRLLFIERATREGDPWSGHIAFPGGMAEPGDRDLRMTALREAREELGLDLANAELIGRLDDLRGRPIPIVVAALVFRLGEEPVFERGHEVEDAFWVNVETLFDPARRMTLVRRRDGVDRQLPAIRMPARDGGASSVERPPLWGLTYRLVANLLSLAGRPL